MEWRDRAYVLTTRKHGENAVILNVLTETRGRASGLVRGGAGRRHRGQLQPGNLLEVTWRGRLEEHLGAFTCELVRSSGAVGAAGGDGLAVLAAAAGVVDTLLPEGEPHPEIFHGLAGLLTALEDPGVVAAYVRWELGVLGELGFGLDLSACAATGATENLTHVSPKSGRAVSAEAAAPYAGRMLVLPGFLLESGGPISPPDLLQGLRLTGYFLESHALSGARNRLSARDRLMESLAKRQSTGKQTPIR
ncbi:MAG: DNA repair protein RecO [Rhodospirillaceae bacterium]